MKLLALLILLPLLGCRAVYIDHRPDGTTRVYAASILTSPAIGNLKWTGPQTTVEMSGYGSKSEVTGADLAQIALGIGKLLIGLP